VPGGVGVGPPGETEIQRLNPNRRAKILETTRWHVLESGSLNLDVESTVVQALSERRPVIQESVDDIVYPPPYEHIPRIRQGYRYFSGILRKGTETEPVLIRCALVPPEVGRGNAPPLFRIELFAATSLKTRFKLKPSDVVEVEAE
jgi:hypothetical protein